MDISRLQQRGPCEWVLPATGRMRVPGVIFATRELVEDMDDKVREQVTNVASLPGIVAASYAMPDAHWGYGFPIGGVAAFDGRRRRRGLGRRRRLRHLLRRAHAAHRPPRRRRRTRRKRGWPTCSIARIPAGLGSTGAIRLSAAGMAAMLKGGARWAVQQGYGTEADLAHIEEHGCVAGADPAAVSEQAKKRQRDEMGTLGSGNHYLEVQVVSEIFDEAAARAYGLAAGDVVVSIHCGSRGLGHQIGTDYLREMVVAAPAAGITLPDRELACAPLQSALGQRYLGAMRAGINCALANRQILTHLARQAFAEVFPGVQLPLLYDVSHNTCKEETHTVEGRSAGCSCIARARRAPSGRATPSCRRSTPRSGSRC